MIKAISLLSGGLDSILATKLILEQKIEIEAVNFLTVFCNCTSKTKSCLASKVAADKLGIKLKVFEISEEYLDIVKKPKYGYGKNMNPCLDCRIFMFKKVATYMKEVNGSFIITGEVLGQRPMSQRRDAINIIERDSNLKRLILRPLSAKFLEPTIPEEKGWVDREKLLSFCGRSRKPQIKLAKDFGINDYPCPSGGCLLTDFEFSKKLKDLMYYKPDFNLVDVKFLKFGRYFKISSLARLIVGRNEEENKIIVGLAQINDLCFEPIDAKGPVAIGRGHFDKEDLKIASNIIATYCKRNNNNEPFKIAYKIKSSEEINYLFSYPLKKEVLESLRI